MNDAIQRQLEERMAELKHYAGIEQCFTCLDEYAEDLARECAALRMLCAMAVEAIAASQSHEFRPEEIAQLKAAAEGKDVA